MTDKLGTGKQIAGYQQTRKDRRPYRVKTLLNKTTASLPAPWSVTADAEKVAGAAEALEKIPLIADDAVMAAMRYYLSRQPNTKKSVTPPTPKVKTATARTCQLPGCEAPADHGVVWADGRAVAVCCKDHTGAMKEHLQKKNGEWAEIVGVRRYDPDAPKGKQLSSLRKTATEFAPGIPIGRQIKGIEKVKPDDPNPDWLLSISKHPAQRRGDHLDLRLVDSKDRAHSWALPAELPKPGQNVYAVQQATHTGEYARRTEPFELPPGYGATRPGAKVEPLYVGSTEVMEAGKDKIRFLRHQGKQTEEFVLRRIDTPDTAAGRMWVLHNATKNVNTGEGKKIPLYKPDYAVTEPEKLNINDPQKVLTAKIDGAHTILHLQGEDKINRVYSYRQPTTRDTGLIEHTHKIPDFQKWRSPEDLKGTIARTELWFADKDGKAIKSTDIGGILNAGTLRSREKQEEMGVTPRFSVIDVVRFKGKNVENRPFNEKLEMMREIAKKVSGVELPPMAFSPDEKKELFKAVKSGKMPETHEGFVERDLSASSDKPVKAVIRPSHDVVVRGIFTEKGQRNMAAGFKYSWTPDGPVVGRVGTGLDHATKKDMLKNPDDYIGRVAMVRSMDPVQNRADPSQLGALRTPAFKGWHPDKNDPDKVKEAMDVESLVGKLRENDTGVERVMDAADKLTAAAETMRPGNILEAVKESIPALSRKARAVMNVAKPVADAVGVQLPIDQMPVKRPGPGLMEMSVKAAADRGYGPAGKWVHDRAHGMMKDMQERYGEEKGKQIAYAVATQQGHAVKKTPKGFRTPEGVREAKAKYDHPKEMQKTALTGPAEPLEKFMEMVGKHAPKPTSILERFRALLIDPEETALTSAMGSVVGGLAGGGAGAASGALSAPEGERSVAAVRGGAEGAMIGSGVGSIALPLRMGLAEVPRALASARDVGGLAAAGGIGSGLYEGLRRRTEE